METQLTEYKGHRIEIRRVEADTALGTEQLKQPELLIDNEPISYGQLQDGLYFINDYAYDWRNNLVDLARGLVDYRGRVGEVLGNIK